MNRNQIIMDQLLVMKAAVDLLKVQVSSAVVIMREELMEKCTVHCIHPVEKRQELTTMGDTSNFSWLCRVCGYVFEGGVLADETGESEVI